MIRIRTITYNLPNELNNEILNKIYHCADEWRNTQYTVHTQRINMPIQNDVDLNKIEFLNHISKECGVRWYNIPVNPYNRKISTDKICKLLGEFRSSFCNIICAKESSINESVIDFCSDTILAASGLSDSGDTNFRLGSSMNVSYNGPFFPFTYSKGGQVSFSIGLELAEEINDIVGSLRPETSASDIRRTIIELLENQISELEIIAEQISVENNIIFDGIDFSLAPLPKKNNSVIQIVNKLGVHDINQVGSMYATAFLTDILKLLGKKHKSIGFCGVMYSLLEDLSYVEMNNANPIRIDKMIALSTMCGCGVDMVPVNYNISKASLRNILLEVACVSSRLQKPLGVRVLPVNASLDGMTHICSDDDFLINTRVVEIESSNSIIWTGENYNFYSRVE